MIDLKLKKTLHGSENQFTLDIEVEIKKGLFVSIYGDSGAGKTSIIRMLAGLMAPDEGIIRVEGETWFNSDQKINLSPQKRKIGFMFQDYALFPNMSVRENLSYALEKGQNDSVIDELIAIVELNDLQKRMPDTLSGGQKQRVALARAIVPKPNILVLDEPLSALNVDMRRKLQDYILKLHRHYNLTTIMISHDISEIIKLSDFVFQVNSGQIINQGSVEDLFLKRKMSGKFQFTGEIVKIENQGIVTIITLLIGKDLAKVVADTTETSNFKTGDTVAVGSKAFNPILYKIK